MSVATPRLLAGPALVDGAEPLRAHLARLGELPPSRDAHATIALLERAGPLGRGGGAFPLARKWAAVAERSGDTVVLANGAEGEPLSAKDALLMATRPHLVLDGAELAAGTVGAERIVLYVGERHAAARAALGAALRERATASHRSRRASVELVTAPERYIAGEETAACRMVNEGDARPTNVPPRPFDAGVGGRPTLVQNVESLAHAALIARHGDGWYREAGRASTRGTTLVTLRGVPRPGVLEIDLGVTLAELAAVAGVPAGGGPVLLGGYGGGWVAGAEAWGRPLDPVELRLAGASLGPGIVAFLDPGECGVHATARVVDYLAGESAAQCGPCAFGLRAIADALVRLARGTPRADDLPHVGRWAGSLAGRGACRHPDGAARIVLTALDVFDAEFARHAAGRACGRGAAAGRAA